MAIETFNRYETKYLVDKETFNKILPTIIKYMEPDKYNVGNKPYTITNLYYDTPDNYLIRTSLDKPTYKQKLRLRAYDVPTQETKVFLEIKKKYDKIVNKRRSTLKLNEAYDFIEKKHIDEINPYMNEQVLNELTYLINQYDLYPKAYIAYDRLAFFAKNDSDIRITFDNNIRTRRYDLGLELGKHGDLLIPNDLMLMEIKVSGSMPLWITTMLSRNHIYKTSFSKYGKEYTNYIQSQNISA